MGRMGVKTPKKHPPVSNLTQSVKSKVRKGLKSNSKYDLEDITTLKGGDMLGIGRPIWMKVQESECRLAWLTDMVRKELIVRDIDSYAKSISGMLRSDELRFKEAERKILMGLMKLKLKDEKLNLKSLQKEKEKMRQRILKEIGRGRKYYTLVKRLRRETIKRKTELKKKYKAKLDHLAAERRKEILEKWHEREIPEELRCFNGCKVFDRAKLEEMKPADVESLVIGDIQLDDDEKQVLKLNPKFAVMVRLDDEEMERDTEIASSKLRYEIRRKKEQELMDEIDREMHESPAKRIKIDRKEGEIEKEKEKRDIIADAQERQVFNPISRQFDYSKRRVTDLQENNKVYLPKICDVKEESEIEMMRNIIMEEYRDYKKDSVNRKIRELKETDPEKIERIKWRNQEYDNLTAAERRGLSKLRKRIEKDEIVVVKTDKSGKMGLISKEKYLEMGIVQIE